MSGTGDLSGRRILLGVYASGAALNESLPKIINAVYVVVKRYLHGRWMYVSERMDDRLWENVEDCWCVDSGLALPLYAPDATLTATAASGPGIAFSANGNIFVGSMVGNVIRMGGGMAVITSILNARAVLADIVLPITLLVPNDPTGMPLPAPSGSWTLGVPVTTVSGLNHLEGKLVSILADGSPLPPQLVVNGTVTLARAASSVVAGLAFTAQLQSLYWDAALPATVQGRRKSVYNVVARIQNTPGPFQLGTNQPDASVQPNQATVAWANMTPVNPPFGRASPQQPYQFFSGDVFADVADSLGTDTAQVAAQQLLPLPLNVIALVPFVDVGDDPGP